jgi:hypothetical protein
MLTAVAVSAVSLTTLAALFAAPAQAEPRGRCNQEDRDARVCLFENPNFNAGAGEAGDHWLTFTSSDRDFDTNEWRDRQGRLTDDGMNDETSSIKTSKGACARIYQDAGFSGTSNLLLPFLSAENMDEIEVGDNEASSLDITC